MNDIRREVSRILERHLEEILDRTMSALIAHVPAVSRQDDEGRALVRASTRHATLAFLTLCADPEREREVAEALALFLDELERDQASFESRDAVGELLRSAEKEEPDLA